MTKTLNKNRQQIYSIDLPLPAIVAVLTEMTIFIICGAGLALHEWLTENYSSIKQRQSRALFSRSMTAAVSIVEVMLQKKEYKLADAEEELAIVKKAVHIFSKPRN
ncbi:hypothetical protein [Paenibacillus sp.]|uniref:hypothetical protein n=1 Tax=Paenibacillus sp. TaxID=58172 RepID=UPI0028A784B6|nr:hypothetical protein [Paenibacillus sp.]